MHRFVFAGVALALSAPLSAQNQVVKPPIAVYWVSAETSAGMAGMQLPVGLGAMMPPGMQGGKRLKLDLGSSQSVGGTPRASHAIPPALAMGQSLPLVTPEAQRASAPIREERSEGTFEPPKGRMLIYWGCGESVRAGQPVVVDFSRMNSQDAARAFRTRNVSRPTGPAQGRNRTFGDWPNNENNTAVPANASLVGEHTVAGNYSPDIRFSVGERHDFMAPVQFDPLRKTGAGAWGVKWQAIPTAIGYFATATGQGERENDVVMWSSSEVQEMGHAFTDYLPPAEVQRLIRERVVLSPQTTSCAVPAGIFRNDGAMLNFIAYGDELNHVHPPRPKDPRQAWEQQYIVKVRNKSTGMTMLSEGMGGSPARGYDSAGGGAAEERAGAAPTPRTPSTADAVQEGINVLRGLFGR